MAYNINLGNYLNNMGAKDAISGVSPQSVSAQGQDVPVSAVKNAAEQIRNMLLGDIFTGEITDLNGTAISIRMGNGQLLNANIMLENQQMTFSKGEMVTFLVSDKNNTQISLKPLDTSAQELIFANKALEASNLAMNKENLKMVKGLVDLNMSIDKNTLTDVARLLTKYPDASLDTVLRLYKLNMPVTQENITQFEAYKSYEHDMTGTIKNLVTDFSGLMQTMASQGNVNDAVTLWKDMLNIFTKGNEGETQTIDGKNQQHLQEGIIQTSKDNLKELMTLVQKEGIEPEDVMKFLKNLETTDGEKLNLIKNLLNEGGLTKEQLVKLTGNNDFKSLLEGTLKETLFLRPENVSDKEDVQEFYKNLLRTVSEGEKLMEKAGLSHTDFAKGMESVKNNLEFMNDLNHQMAYMQIPIKFQEGEVKGDLYVYTNKKSLAGNKDELTALLHLDMENLGAMDIYVKMANGNHVSTNFCLESEDMLDFIYAHIDLLTERLNKKGYNFTPTMTVRDTENDESDGKVDFVKDFLDAGTPVIPVSRYMFDIKA